METRHLLEGGRRGADRTRSAGGAVEKRLAIRSLNIDGRFGVFFAANKVAEIDLR